MKIETAIVIVQLDDGKAYQVDISSDNVIALLAMYQYRNNCSIDIIDKPLIGVKLTPNVLKET